MLRGYALSEKRLLSRFLRNIPRTVIFIVVPTRQQCPQIVSQFFHGGPSNKPPTVVNLVDLPVRVKDESIGDGNRRVAGVRVVHDVQFIDQRPVKVNQEGPRRADAFTKCPRRFLIID